MKKKIIISSVNWKYIDFIYNNIVMYYGFVIKEDMFLKIYYINDYYENMLCYFLKFEILI